MLGILKMLHEVAGHTKHVLCKAARLIPNDVGLLIQWDELQADQGAAPVRGSVSSGWVEDDGPRNAGDLEIDLDSSLLSFLPFARGKCE